MALFKGNPVINWWQRYVGQFNHQERTPAQTEPYKSDVVGFNTRFSYHELDRKFMLGKQLTKDELQYYNYVRANDLQPF